VPGRASGLRDRVDTGYGVRRLSDACFPWHRPSQELVNPGTYGKALAQYLKARLTERAYAVPETHQVCVAVAPKPGRRWSWRRFRVVDATPHVTKLFTDLSEEAMQFYELSLAEQTFAVTGARFRQEVDAAEPRLRALSETRAASSPAPAKWSPKEVLGHLIDSAANNHQRFVRVQADRDLSLSGYAQDFWVDTQRYSDRAWSELIDLWHSYNRHLAHVITNIPEAKGNVHCRIADGTPVTLRHVALDYVGHLQHHLRQIFQKP